MTSKQWIDHFAANAKCYRVNWEIKPTISEKEVCVILSSLQAWQLGETSDGKNLLRAATLYSKKINDSDYVEAVKLFIKEEQKHGNSLGRYLDEIGQKRITYNWGDYLFRKIRYFNTSMEIWTLTVIVVESTAQIFYQSLKDATNCALLKQIATDILIDEAYHIDFQTQRMQVIFSAKNNFEKLICHHIYKLFFFTTSLVVWFAHKKIFQAGGNNFSKYRKKMGIKYMKTLNRISGYSMQESRVTSVTTT
ncbi:ferritin-like domain-containing protein [Danxiaibacter flavus]|uniref:Ferritin-like domain-containing protein n=1 Tax=Danxiaibacter flavus TaxID=3049108 RepID=A0ABV3ZDY7_9BACT|nr:ferritin-like domain-containing protein [Chitinophagaceae bacterium DXS]